MFARLRLQRLSSFSSRFVTVERVVLHRSAIILTPYRADGTIDAGDLATFIDREYAAAGLAHDDVDTGAVILTGNALESRNASEIGRIFAAHGGKFVCATAGHRLESILAAHGSGAVPRSRRESSVVLNIDVGGGTTKLALVDRGEIVATSAIKVGARCVPLAPDAAERRRTAARLARSVVAAAWARPTEDLALLDPLPRTPRPSVVTFSGGVGELMEQGADGDYGDLGPELAAALREARADLPGRVADAEEAIRATVIGASQFSVQLSGNTIFLSDPGIVPLWNVPVARVRAREIDGARELSVSVVADAVRAARDHAGHEGQVLIALPDLGEPRYDRLRAVAEGLARGVGDRRPLLAATAGDVARSLGTILADELAVEGGIVVLDGLELSDLDYVDVGKIVLPAGVVPVVVKTLVLGAR
ncbi:MAG: ethanolamine ammonia-lyase reactivating factor EutA [Chloroflexota bacterium]|nr:ethanolamine ammonia-lyase reactivating factor EutA [Chloroflexota bacterium]MDE3193866.1 ethanolamine ammonia-lyase reactivating factor EutA [Chloroflexota bacterium]